MHNVNILTIHKEPNYGAVLQAYALYKTIENLGHTLHHQFGHGLQTFPLQPQIQGIAWSA